MRGSEGLRRALLLGGLWDLGGRDEGNCRAWSGGRSQGGWGLRWAWELRGVIGPELGVWVRGGGGGGWGGHWGQGACEGL